MNRSSQAAAPAPREVSETVFELLLSEMASHFVASEPPGPAAQFALEGMGFQVGCSVAERCARDRSRFAGELDAVKFLCKDVWTALFGKQVDNLKTNYKARRLAFPLP